MSTEAYIPEKYFTIDDAYDACGIEESDQANLTEAEKNRFERWTREGNDKIEVSLFPDSDSIPLVAGSQIFTYARDAGLNWVLYKKRTLTGSINAKEAKSDYQDNIKLAQTYLKRQPTDKNFPIQKAEHTDSLEDFLIPYSQSQGFPTETLY